MLKYLITALTFAAPLSLAKGLPLPVTAVVAGHSDNATGERIARDGDNFIVVTSDREPLEANQNRGRIYLRRFDSAGLSQSEDVISEDAREGVFSLLQDSLGKWWFSSTVYDGKHGLITRRRPTLNALDFSRSAKYGLTSPRVLEWGGKYSGATVPFEEGMPLAVQSREKTPAFFIVGNEYCCLPWSQPIEYRDGAYVMKVSPDGTKIKEHIFSPSDSKVVFLSSSVAENGDLLVSGYRQPLNAYAGKYYLEPHLLVGRFDPELTRFQIFEYADDIHYREAVPRSNSVSGIKILPVPKSHDLLVLSSVARTSKAPSMGFPPYSAAAHSIRLLRLTENGSIVWEKVLGGNGSVVARAMQLTPDQASLVVTGTTRSLDKNEAEMGDSDLYLEDLALEDGHSRWEKIYGGQNNDGGNDLAISEAGIFVTGFANAFDRKSGHQIVSRFSQTLVLRTNLSGDVTRP